jgi:hypothetical protein
MAIPERYAPLLEQLVTELKTRYGDRLVSVAVYGSVGRGTPRPDSDVDVLIVVRDLPRTTAMDSSPAISRACASASASSVPGGSGWVTPGTGTSSRTTSRARSSSGRDGGRVAVTSEDLARSYLKKARARLKALATLRDLDDHSDVMREAQELVELALKAVLRAIGIEPPKFHELSGISPPELLALAVD